MAWEKQRKMAEVLGSLPLTGKTQMNLLALVVGHSHLFLSHQLFKKKKKKDNREF